MARRLARLFWRWRDTQAERGQLPGVGRLSMAPLLNTRRTLLGGILRFSRPETLSRRA